MYQGLTGSQGRFYGLRNRDYGTQVVAGTNPKKAGTDVDGIPIFATVKEAVAETGANASCVFIPAPGVSDAVLEAAEGGIEFIVVITEGVPAHDEACFYNQLRRDYPGVRLLGPNCPGIISPGKCQHRDHRGRDRHRRRPGRDREPLGHAHVPGAARDDATRDRPDHVRRHRRRPRARHELHRLPPAPSRPTPRRAP